MRERARRKAGRVARNVNDREEGGEGGRAIERRWEDKVAIMGTHSTAAAKQTVKGYVEGSKGPNSYDEFASHNREGRRRRSKEPREKHTRERQVWGKREDKGGYRLDEKRGEERGRYRVNQKRKAINRGTKR